MNRPLKAALLLGMSLLCGATCFADVTIKGKVEWFDQISMTYKPARRVRVAVEGPWLYAPFITGVRTDDGGNYTATVPDPPAITVEAIDTPLGRIEGKSVGLDYDGVWVEAYAETPGVCAVLEHMTAPTPQG